MSLSQSEAVSRARADLAKLLGVAEGDIKEAATESADFPNSTLGAPLKGEMAMQMITSGHRIKLGAAGKSYEYRTDSHQLRLYKFKGANFRIS